MTRTKLDTPAFADQSVDSRNIADGAVQAQDITDGTVSVDKLNDTLDLSSKTVTLPNTSVANTKLANSAFTINGSSVALGASLNVTLFVEWQAVTVADGSTTLTAQAGKGYFLDTNTGVIEVFLPTSPSRGDTIILVDYSGTFATNKCIVNTGTQNLDSTVYPEYKVETNNSIVQLVYVDSTKGWQVTLSQAAGTTPDQTGIESGGGYDTVTFVEATGGTVLTVNDFKTHIFTGSSNFVVSGVATTSSCNVAEYLVIGGGGGGGKHGTASGAVQGAGGGGAGGWRHFSSLACTSPTKGPAGITLSAGTYPITVGAGGAQSSNNSCLGASGGNSIFSTITSTGGGGGGSQSSSPAGNGANGGSGGGGGGVPGPQGQSAGGSGNTPPVSPSQGSDGGNGSARTVAPASNSGGGGGGGASQAAPDNSQHKDDGGPAGNGQFVVGGFFGPTAPSYGQSPSPLAPNGRYFSGGGGGGSANTPGGQGQPGAGGGGIGGNASNPHGAGTANTGGGGGGPSSTTCQLGAGGSGIVAIRYKFQ